MTQPTTQMPSFGLIIIGDEILSGKQNDQHFKQIIHILAQRGLQLAWVEYLSDDRSSIAATLARTRNSDTIVMCCGGIGATPDDHTRQAAALAFDLPLLPHPEAIAKIKERVIETHPAPIDFASAENRQRFKMAELPQGAALIPNPYNKIPGFSLGLHYFVPGFPVMAWPMLEWVLDTYHANLFHAVDYVEQSLIVRNASEAFLTPLMEAIEARYAPVKIFSLPHADNANRYIELGVKGQATHVESAFIELRQSLMLLGCQIEAASVASGN